jgi:hypothetical protein
MQRETKDMRRSKQIITTSYLFTGLLTWQCEAHITNTVLNQTVLFIKEADVAFTNDYWKVAVKFDLSPYDKAIETLKADLLTVTGLAHATPLIEEIHQVQTVVNSLERTLTNLKRFLPKPEKKRGLLDIGGSFLKVLFGTATITDLADLHATVDALSHKQGEVVHALNHQLTYVKQLGDMVRIDHEAIANWSYVLKDFALKEQDKFQKTVTRLEWSVKLQEATTAVRQIEFSVTQMELELSKILQAFNTLVMGRFSPSLLSPIVLHGMLTNLTLNLPEGYELVMGTQYNNLFWYYKHVKAALLADLNCFMLVMNFPLTAVNRNYELYRVIAFPTKILNRTFASYKFEREYLAISTFRQSYLMVCENDVKRCEGETIKICPANDAAQSTLTKSCVLSVFFQRNNIREVCQRVVTTQQPSPVLRRLGGLILYFTPEPQPVHFRCREGSSWTTVRMQLQGTGTLQGAQSCHVTFGDLQLYAEVRGSSQFEAPNPLIMVTPQLSVASDSELAVLKNALNTDQLDELISRVSSHKLEANINDLVHLHPLTMKHAVHTSWTTPLLIATATILFVVIIYYCLYTLEHFNKMLQQKKQLHSPELGNTRTDPSSQTCPSLETPKADQRPSASGTSTDFVMYAVHQK